MRRNAGGGGLKAANRGPDRDQGPYQPAAGGGVRVTPSPTPLLRYTRTVMCRAARDRHRHFFPSGRDGFRGRLRGATPKIDAFKAGGVFEVSHKP
ncbi:hypothetical protein MTP99_017776 [Tenebrio molitor]|jgi:hypothetical protein|nr:hypothetical protein MTP99_017776 [Tenebrio molitor]